MNQVQFQAQFQAQFLVQFQAQFQAQFHLTCAACGGAGGPNAIERE